MPLFRSETIDVDRDVDGSVHLSIDIPAPRRLARRRHPGAVVHGRAAAERETNAVR